MRKHAHVEASLVASDAGPLEAGLLEQLAAHRRDGRLEEWEQSPERTGRFQTGAVPGRSR